MLHCKILLPTYRGIPIGHLEKRRRTRVNNRFKSEFKSETRYEKQIEEQASNYFANPQNKTKGRTLLTMLAFLQSSWLWYHSVTPGFKAKPNAHSMCAQESSFHTYTTENGYIKINVTIIIFITE
jgi:hypothetical protein